MAGLVTPDENLLFKLSPQLRCWLPDSALEREFVPMESATLRLPERFPPDESFLEFHRKNIFQER